MLIFEFKRKTLNTCEVTIRFSDGESFKFEGSLVDCLQNVAEILAAVSPRRVRL